MYRNIILATCGAVLFLTVAWAHIVFTQGEFYRFSDETPQNGLRQIEIAHSISPSVAVRGMFPQPTFTSMIFLNYSEEMKENETQEVTIEYSASISKSDSHGYVIKTPYRPPKSFSIGLSSSSFHIAPSASIKKEKDADLPAQFLWTVTPQKEGEHYLIVDLNELPRINYVEVPGYFELFTVNGKKRDREQWSTPTLQVKVYTYLGISKKTLFCMELVCSIIGFILMCPLCVGCVRNWMATR